MTYHVGQVVEVCSEQSREWTSGFSYGSKITLKRLRGPSDVFAGEWDAVTRDGAKGIITEKHFRPVAEGPVRTVTRQEIIPGTYDGVVVSYEHDHRLTVHFMVERPSADTLTRAAAVITALAGALRDGN